MNCSHITSLSKHLLSLGTSFCIPESKKSVTCPLKHVMTSFLHLIIVINLFRRIHDTTLSHFADSWCYHKQQQSVCEFLLDVHLLHSETVWWNAPCIWQDSGPTLPFQTRLTQTKPVLPLSNKHSSQVKDQGWISIKNFPIGLHMMYL
jgi:hypothetical protein